MSALINSLQKIAHMAYPLTDTRKKLMGLAALGCRVGLFAVSYLESNGSLTSSAAPLLNLGLGAASLVCHYSIGVTALVKDGVEMGPLIAFDTLSILKIMSVSTLGFTSLLYLTTTTGIYWIAVPLVHSQLPELTNYLLGDKTALKKKNDLFLANY